MNSFMEYKVLSNHGQVAYAGPNQHVATNICIERNAEYQNTPIFFTVVPITPYRLLTDIRMAELTQSFVYEIVSPYKVAWYMTPLEYQLQLNRPDSVWLIKGYNQPLFTLEAQFDDIWYEQFKNK